jgi:hypothetical protein
MNVDHLIVLMASILRLVAALQGIQLLTFQRQVSAINACENELHPR